MMDKLFFILFGISSLSCVESKEIETGIVEEIVEENPIWWDDCSYNVSDHICNLRLATAMDIADELYNYHGEMFVLEVTSMRCSDCQRSSGQNDYIQTRVGHVRWITIIIENEAGITPSTSDGRRWANAFTLSYFYVWLGSRGNIDIHTGRSGFPYSEYPFYVLVDDDLLINLVIEGYDKNKIINNITELKISL